MYFESQQAAIAYIESQTRAVSFDVTAHRRKRSMSQNAYYWGVVVPIFGLEFGYTSEETHQTFRGLFLAYEKNGEKFTKSTTELTTVEFEDYLHKVRTFASEHGCIIPLPNENLESFYEYLSKHEHLLK